MALKLAGRLGSLVHLEHVDRRPGATRHTPVRAFRRGDRVAVGASFGREPDWVKNVQAAGHAHIRVGGEALDHPRLVDLVDAAPLPPWCRIALRYIVRTNTASSST
ncbi:nitroreductase family deazaflavin-dependent oxidoreductase [Lapillicoccus sp.]|uniref:nitroreductase family deazaflavin-dependent oxidoreductase n=1 Tax=Lapillicoccus sp. TaxID=1909287 RepID=UPI003265E788